MDIQFRDEAYETFQRVVALLATYTVRLQVELEDGWAVFDAQILGPDLDAEDGATVRYRKLDAQMEPAGPELSAVAKWIFVY